MLNEKALLAGGAHFWINVFCRLVLLALPKFISESSTALLSIAFSLRHAQRRREKRRAMEQWIDSEERKADGWSCCGGADQCHGS